MKRFLLLLIILPLFTQCKKEKYCNICSTFNDRTYTDGSNKKDTIKLQVCEDEDFIKAYIKNGTFDGQHYEVKAGDTIYFHLKAATTCTRK